MKSFEEQFVDWEAEVFGCGYGTGEKPILEALKVFFETTRYSLVDYCSYDYMELEDKLGASTTWLLITALIKADVIYYGTNPRFGALTKGGEYLKGFLELYSVDQLYEFVCSSKEHDYCTKSYCNCIDSKDSEAGCKNNIFFEGGI